MENSNLCGVHATYLALGFLDFKSRSIEMVLDFYPNARLEGVSLSQIKDFFQKNGFYAKIDNVSNYHISQASSDLIYIELKNDKSFPHFVVKRKLFDSDIQVIDFPNIFFEDKFNQVEFTNLVISNKPITSFEIGDIA